MKKTISFFVIALLLHSLNINAQCCSAFAGLPKSYCRDSVQIGGTPSYTASCGKGCGTVLYFWSPSAGLNNPNVANPWAHPSTTTVYTLEVVILNNTTHDTCCKSTSTTTVTVLPRCSANAGSNKVICCPGNGVTIGGNPAAVDSCSRCDSTLYSWLPTTGLSNSHAANPTASPSANTVYTLHIYAYNKTTHDTCCTAASTVTVTVNNSCCRSAGVGSNESEAKVKIYPNPAAQFFTIEIDQSLNSGLVEVYDVSGKLVWQKTGIKESTQLVVDLSNASKGVYFVKIKDSGVQVYSKKVLLQ